ncbi:hypothetical protein PAAG_04536 [Paracoccidioides lutzii Pb01]|uniref:Uncharacterized protein n=1 Tax=Paracoccidioides lutzii (strain ATCC MYA-826 / Pb01) TaxID=502779 RepID=C1H192_PARBA|nr:hypothetical protein PAAG_04536 [Paracoccidioides lutzii Pb01]EEH33486.2 hypothetical protein PAAG_04536 [Paracoccidioides lutzii Pb01]
MYFLSKIIVGSSFEELQDNTWTYQLIYSAPGKLTNIVPTLDASLMDREAYINGDDKDKEKCFYFLHVTDIICNPWMMEGRSFTDE